jgi:glycosyltransferase involved in cell wall biosynthesis
VRQVRVVVDARKAFDGGIGRHAREILRRLPGLLPEARFSLLVAPGRDAASLAAEGLAGGPFTLHEEPAGKYGPGEWIGLPRRIRRLGPDLYHTPHYVLPPGLGCPTLVTVHDLIHLDRPRTPLHALYARVVLGRSLRAATGILTVSRATRARIVSRLGVEPSRIEVIPNGVEIPEATDSEVRLGGASGREPYLLVLGSLKPHKNLETLVEAVHLAGARIPPLRVHGHWVREGRARRRLEGRIRRLGLEQRVLLLGPVPEVCLDRLYRGALVYVAPALEEGFGLTPLEALARGVPVVASRRGGHPEALGDVPRWVEGADPLELAQALVDLVGDPEARRAQARAGPRQAARFTWAAAARGTARAYRRALFGPPAGSH